MTDAALSMPTPAASPREPSTRRSVQPAKPPQGADAVWESGVAAVVTRVPRRERFLRGAERVLQEQPRIAPLDDRTLREELETCRAALRRAAGRGVAHRLDRGSWTRTLAVLREAAKRSLGLEPYREQIAAVMAMHAGCCAEVATGEGKTLAAGLLAVLHGGSGRGCHVVTVNDYLAERDAETIGPLYDYCGLRVGVVTEETPPEARRAAYDSDITYATNKSLAADYLRDRLLLSDARTPVAEQLRDIVAPRSGEGPHTVMRGLSVAIVDEADSILIDEAVTPLILSGASPNAEQTEAFRDAAALAQDLEPRLHYRVNAGYREVRLTTAGRARLAELCRDRGGLWAGERRREELVAQALTAVELFERDKHYVVQDDKVVIVDEFTGRLMPDRTWRDGLHQAVEAKEGLEIQPPKATFARVSFQRFFRSYRRLCGMTGTAREASVELWRTYRLPVVRIPTHRPCIRRHHAPRVFADRQAKLDTVGEIVCDAYRRGRPVLVGTRSVETSEQLSKLLETAKVPHRVLNAVRHREEAEIVKLAGQRKAVTIATNMAGRGTDIKLAPGVPELGGLLVVAAEPNDSARVDRQLFGRSGRQGDPGEAVACYSLDDELLQRYTPRRVALMKSRLRAAQLPGLGASAARLLIRVAQRRAQRRAAASRRLVLRQDHQLHEQLGFAPPE